MLLPKRRWVLLVVASAMTVAVVASLLALFAVGRKESPLKAKYNRIQPGMTLAEVREIMGESTCEVTVLGPRPGRAEPTVVWECDEAVIEVRFEAQGESNRVTGKGCYANHEPTFWERLRARLGL